MIIYWVLLSFYILANVIGRYVHCSLCFTYLHNTQIYADQYGQFTVGVNNGNKVTKMCEVYTYNLIVTIVVGF